MRWFFVVNSEADKWFESMIKVAVTSASQNTDLEPHCIYDGGDSELSRWLIRHGVAVHNARVPFFDELSAPAVLEANKGSAYVALNAAGAYLKLSIADYVADDEVFLYTDCDVMFSSGLNSRSLLRTNGFWAVGEIDGSGATPEVSLANRFNSGVFVTTGSVFKKASVEATDVSRKRNFFFWGEPGFYDQGALNLVLQEKWLPLEPEYNWRGYWARNDYARIVHFHGPKPVQIARVLFGMRDRVDTDNIANMIKNNRDALVYWLWKYNDFLEKS